MRFHRHFLLACLLAIVISCQQNSAPSPAAPSLGVATNPAAAWSYEQVIDESAWGTAFPDCIGQNQSPINIITTPNAPAPVGSAPQLSYQSSSFSVVNNGHTIQFNADDNKNYVMFNGDKYTLRQFHLHAPGEHHVQNASYDMELHLVHQNANGQYLVLGVLMQVPTGPAPNTTSDFATVWSEALQLESGPATCLDGLLNPSGLLPTTNTVYEYDGSLTTPPCSEAVNWFVFSSPVQISQANKEGFLALIGANNREIQPLNNRTIYILPGI